MISPKKYANGLKDKSKKPDINIIDGINKLQNSVLAKASVLKGIVKDCSIGPLSTCSDLDNYYDSSPTGSFATSTPDQSINEYFDSEELNGNDVDSVLPSAILSKSELSKKELLNTSQKSIVSNLNQPSISHRKKIYNKKLLQFEEERREMLAIKINERVQKIVNKDKEIQRNIDEIKQELQLARAQIEIERTQKLLREEELLANEAQQLKHDNEQRCNQRLTEANERIKKTLLKQQKIEEQHKQYLKEMKLRLDKIHEFQFVYRGTYQQLLEVIKYDVVSWLGSSTADQPIGCHFMRKTLLTLTSTSTLCSCLCGNKQFCKWVEKEINILY